MLDRIPMTRIGYDKLKAEVDHLDTVEMPLLSERVAAARSEGDLSENAEYHGARESQGLMQAKINLLRDKLSRAVIVAQGLLGRKIGEKVSIDVPAGTMKFEILGVRFTE